MPELSTAILMLTLLADATIFLFVGYYFWRLRSKEVEMDAREGKFDRDYHSVVDAALAKERKIIEDATAAADEIIAKAKNINDTVTKSVAKALDDLDKEIKAQAKSLSSKMIDEYKLKMTGVSQQAVADLENVLKELRSQMLVEIQNFEKNNLKSALNELEEYRKFKMEEIDKKSQAIAQKAAEELFNRALPLEDQQALVIAALEKAKREGVFE